MPLAWFLSKIMTPLFKMTSFLFGTISIDLIMNPTATESSLQNDCTVFIYVIFRGSRNYRYFFFKKKAKGIFQVFFRFYIIKLQRQFNLTTLLGIV